MIAETMAWSLSAVLTAMAGYVVYRLEYSPFSKKKCIKACVWVKTITFTSLVFFTFLEFLKVVLN